MIVDPDFLDHWRTRMLVDALGGDEMAPMYVMRIWGHCQQRHGDRFAMPAAGLKALCKASGDAQALETALIDAGFVVREGAEICVPKWAEKNASLLAAWENGNKGGRPKKQTQTKPTGYESETQQEPSANPSETQTKPIRVEKRREEEKHPPTPKGEGRFPEFWNLWPNTDRKQDRKKCFAKWQRNGWDSIADEVIAHVAAMKQTRKWLDGFEPAPLTYLNGERWNDGVEAPPANNIFAGAY